MAELRMFQPGAIGTVQIRNRIVMPAMATNFASAHGEPTPRMIAYYAARAKGGAGLIVVENASIDEPSGGNGTVQLRIDHDRYIPGLSALATAVQEYGAVCAIQINHAGVVAKPERTGVPVVGPSSTGWTSGSRGVVALTSADIRRIVARYAQAAVRVRRSGFDGVEIHGAHGYLIAQFMSPITNRRRDAYGGSAQNRWRFAQEVVRAVREAVGPAFPIIFRLSADEFMPEGRTLEESVELAPTLVEAGIDALNVSAGTSANPEVQLEPMAYEEGWRAYLAAAFKATIEIPVITVGVFRHPSAVEKVLEQDQADFVAIGRGLIADPQWPRKVRSGEASTILHCISCNGCVRRRVFDDLPIACSVNPTVGFEGETPCGPAGAKRLVIVGGGPAGLQAATTAASLGATVTLLEQRRRLGGQLHYAAMPPFKSKIGWLIEDLVSALPPSVRVRLGVEAIAPEILAVHPDAVILATGSVPSGLGVPIAADASVQTAEAALASAESLDGVTVAVIGAGMVGCETALACATRGAQVFLLEALADAAQDCEPISRAVLLRHLEEHHVRILTQRRVLEIASDRVVVDEGGVRVSIPASHVVLATGSKSHDPLSEALRAESFPLFLIGDARRPRGIIEAVSEGWRAAQHAVSCSPRKRGVKEERCNES